jgi:hypothetical protein
MNCKDCLHYKACEDIYYYLSDDDNPVFDEQKYAMVGCAYFSNRSEWVHLPSDEYTFTVRGDIAKELIISNCRAAEKVLEE